MAIPLQEGEIDAALTTLLSGKVPPRLLPRTSYPADDTKMESGIYVSDPFTISRESFSLWFGNGGGYTVTDNFWIKYVDVTDSGSLEAIQDVLEDFANNPIFADNYWDVTYEVEQVYQDRAIRFTYTYTLKRTEFR